MSFSKLTSWYDRSWKGLKLSPLLEMGIFFALYFLIFHFLYPIDFHEVSPHPFWIIVLLMTVQYGIKEGVIAAFLSILFYFLEGIPAQTYGEDYFAYHYAVWKLPLLWTLTAFVLGAIVERKQGYREDLKKNLEATQIREKEVTRGYEMLKGIKENLEARLASQLRTSINTYQALKSLEELRPAKVLLGIEGLVRSILNPTKFSIYALGPVSLEASINVGWEKGDNFIRRFSPDSLLYLEIVGKRRVVCALNKEDAFILGGEGILAAPLLDEESKAVFGMLKIEGLDVEELTISNIEAFRLICEVAGVAYAHAMSYERTAHSGLFDQTLPVYSPEFLNIQKDYLTYFAETLGSPLAEVKIEMKLSEKESGLTHLLAEKLRQISSTLFGPLSQLFHSKAKGAAFTLLLPAIPASQLDMTLEILKQELKRVPEFDQKEIVVKRIWLEELRQVEAYNA